MTTEAALRRTKPPSPVRWSGRPGDYSARLLSHQSRCKVNRQTILARGNVGACFIYQSGIVGEGVLVRADNHSIRKPPVARPSETARFELFLEATRGVAIALVSFRQRKRRQPGLAADGPEFVGRPQLVGASRAIGPRCPTLQSSSRRSTGISFQMVVWPSGKTVSL